jgi:hypothetical protein
MSARIERNPNAERDIKREVVGNLTPRFKSALAAVTFPDHGEHPTLDPKSEEWQIRTCCERAVEMGREAVAKVLER